LSDSIREVLADEVKHDGAFADAVGDSADRPIANVADGEDAGDVGFEEIGVTLEGPAWRAFAVT
jgi:hypothetical protein